MSFIEKKKTVNFVCHVFLYHRTLLKIYCVQFFLYKNTRSQLPEKFVSMGNEKEQKKPLRLAPLAAPPRLRNIRSLAHVDLRLGGRFDLWLLGDGVLDLCRHR